MNVAPLSNVGCHQPTRRHRRKVPVANEQKPFWPLGIDAGIDEPITEPAGERLYGESWA